MIFKYEQSLVSPDELSRCAERLSEYTVHLKKIAEEAEYLYDESSINLPGDKENYSLVQGALREKISDKLSLIVVAGIGGSSLGTKAVYDAILGEYDALDTRVPKIIFAETNDPEYQLHIESSIKEKVLSPENILVFVVTKSGTTRETVLNKDRITKTLSDVFSFEGIKERLVYITGKGTSLWDEGEEKGIPLLAIPEKVGGRFSVLSTVGLAPLLAAGIDVKELLDGAEDMKKRCLSDTPKDNIAMLSASILFVQYKKGFDIHDSFFFEVELESLGKWYRQLLAESIGKKEDKAGNIVHTGITPTTSIGTQDLHSVLELNLGGPKNKITTFVATSPKEGVEGQYDSAMDNAYENIKSSYTKNELPFMEIMLPEISAYSLGEYMQFKMMEIMYLGQLFEINPFIQPSVEEYKENN